MSAAIPFIIPSIPHPKKLGRDLSPERVILQLKKTKTNNNKQKSVQIQMRAVLSV